MKPYRLSDNIIVDLEQVAVVEHEAGRMRFTLQNGRVFDYVPKTKEPMTLMEDIHQLMLMGRRQL